MPRLPSPIKALDTKSMAFNTQNLQDVDESFHDLSESPSNYSPNLSELDESCEELGNENLQLSPNASDNGSHSPVMSSKRACRLRNQSQTSRKKGKEQQKKIASDLRAKKRAAILSNKKPEKNLEP